MRGRVGAREGVSVPPPSARWPAFFSTSPIAGVSRALYAAMGTRFWLTTVRLNAEAGRLYCERRRARASERFAVGAGAGTGAGAGAACWLAMLARASGSAQAASVWSASIC